MPWLIPTTGVPWTNAGSGLGAHVIASQFKPDVDLEVTHAAWYRSTSNAAGNAGSLKLWRVSDQANLWTSGVLSDTGVVGWQVAPIDPPISLTAGVAYVISGFFGGNVGFPQITSSSVGISDPPLRLDVPLRRYLTTGSHIWPTGNSSDFLHGLNIFTPTPASGAALTPTDVRNELAAWLHEDDHTETQSFPALSHLLGVDTNAKIDVLDGIVDDILATIDTAMGPGGTLVTGAVRTALDALYSLLKTDVETQPAVIMGPGNPTIADVMGAVAAIPAPERCGFPLTVGDADWTEVGQTVGSGGTVWAQPADAYKVHIEELAGEVRTAFQVGTETLYWLRGWARPWDGVGVYPQSIPLSGLDAVIVSGERWPGIMMWFPPGVEWVLTAYDYTP